MKCFLILFVLLFRIMKLRKLIRPMSPIREVKPIEYLPAPMETSPSSFLARERDISNLLSWFLSSDSTENCSCFRLVPFSDSRKSYSIHSITLTVGFAPLPSTCEGAQRRRLPLFIEASDWLMELNLSPSLIYSLCLWNTLLIRSISSLLISGFAEKKSLNYLLVLLNIFFFLERGKRAEGGVRIGVNCCSWSCSPCSRLLLIRRGIRKGRGRPGGRLGTRLRKRARPSLGYQLLYLEVPPSSE